MSIALTRTFFKSTIGRPKAVMVAIAIDTKTGLPVACGAPAWGTDSGGNVVIYSVPGLAAGGSYKLTFLSIG